MIPVLSKLRTLMSLVETVQALEERLAYLEHFNNQQSILVDTLIDIMGLSKKKEL